MRLVLLHGFTGSAQSFAHLGLDAIAPDLPGHAGAPDATSWEAALDALAKLLEPGPVVLAGYSLGARLALGLALRHPERVHKLVLESGTAGLDEPRAQAARRKSDEALAQLLEREGLEAFLDRWEAHPTLASLLPFAAQLRPERLRHRPEGLASALRALGPGAQPSYWPQLPGLRVPTLLLAGADDLKFAGLARRLHALLPRSALRLFGDCGHAPHLEHPAAFAAALNGDGR